MYGKRLVLLAVFAVLVLPLGASSADNPPRWNMGALISPGKNYTDYLRYYSTGTKIDKIQLNYIGFVDYVTKNRAVSSKYLKMVPSGSSTYRTLKAPLVVEQASGNIVIPMGTKYWVRQNIRPTYTPSSVIKIAVKVRPDIPLRKQHCLVTQVVATASDSSGWTEVAKGRGYCMSGRQWLTPVVR